jgi:hypothetical protein
MQLANLWELATEHYTPAQKECLHLVNMYNEALDASKNGGRYLMPCSQCLLTAPNGNARLQQPTANTCCRPIFPDELNNELRKRGYPPYLKDKFEKDRERNKFKDRPGACRLLEHSESARGRLWAAAMTGISGSTMFNGVPLSLDPDLLALARRSESSPLPGLSPCASLKRWAPPSPASPPPNTSGSNHWCACVCV